MKIYAPLALAAMALCGTAFAQSLEFSKTAVDSSNAGAKLKATMIMEDGKKHDATIKLQDDVAVKDLSNGSLIYVKKHGEIFQVTGTQDDSNGNKIVQIKSTNLLIDGSKKLKDSKLSPKQDDKAGTSNSGY